MLAVVAFSAAGRCVSAGFEPFSWQQKPRWEKQLPLTNECLCQATILKHLNIKLYEN
jgi:hypothetical protein